ncbi:MAG: hypothetical protein BZY88_16185 [SAR202 cluster bacterium Io17-Chloro-G9]|nr:MAG: hypothetical protein BZY88_16185 [SAR202 cluster bacterium Io17-Chloro-G9]
MTNNDSMKAIVFDWDLTLWNSWDTHLELLRQTADALGAPRPSSAEVAARYSMPFLQHLEWYFPGDQKRVVDTYMRFYQRIVTEMPDLYPGVVQTLGSLKESGYRLAVFSDKRQVFGEAELAQTGIGGLMDYSLFLVDGRPYKPDPQGLLHVLDAMGVAPDQALYVGDTGDDMECARRAGVKSGAALWGALDREKTLSAGPGFQWESPNQLLGSLGR